MEIIDEHKWRLGRVISHNLLVENGGVGSTLAAPRHAWGTGHAAQQARAGAAREMERGVATKGVRCGMERDTG
jgi:hypothetical protein